MRKIMHWMLTAILCICGASIFTSCSNDNSDNPADAETGAPAIEGLAEKMMGMWNDGRLTKLTLYILTL